MSTSSKVGPFVASDDNASIPYNPPCINTMTIDLYHLKVFVVDNKVYRIHDHKVAPLKQLMVSHRLPTDTNRPPVVITEQHAAYEEIIKLLA